MGEVSCNEYPWDTHTNLNDPESNPEKWPHQAKPTQKKEIKLQYWNCNFLYYDKIQQLSCIFWTVNGRIPWWFLEGRVAMQSCEIDCRCDHYIPHTWWAHCMARWATYKTEMIVRKVIQKCNVAVHWLLSLLHLLASHQKDETMHLHQMDRYDLSQLYDVSIYLVLFHRWCGTVRVEVENGSDRRGFPAPTSKDVVQTESWKYTAVLKQEITLIQTNINHH